ncbi:hypothetical protein J4050_07995 [Winogradskyella sp. DF17]|uniref:Monogalactosyldiacylglycerol (MGDG) synthase n=1 Tax=Winogradskyella pelagia TaxID=2819984 RepID=A0ABS3T1Q6_9FLAO|nr:hypothetical protein [Winogradskyella sp. DF17]MBO3116683.1 hypothetical protein [Winogradskyella sp. DF17]
MFSKKHVLIVVPDGVGIKNYLYSKIPTLLKESAHVTIWSTLPIEAFDEIRHIHKLQFNFKQITLKAEHWLVRLHRESSTYARLKFYSRIKKNPTILTYWRPQDYNLKVRILYALSQFIGTVLSKNYNRIIAIERHGNSRISKSYIESFAKELSAMNLDSILITHQRVPGLLPLCIAADQLKIKTVTAIFSWDNLPKARLAVRTTKYLVWSAWMKNEMRAYYPEIPQSDIIISGTPQFEFYTEHNRIKSRQEFADEYSLDSSKAWICYSGDDVTTSPYDPQYLLDIARALEPVASKIQIIFRRCPVDFSERYDGVINEFKDLIRVIDPLWNIDSQLGWTGYFPKYQDINIQVNLAYHCDLVLNLGSTMALDFATFNKPCIYLNYNPSNDSAWSTKVIYEYEHFQSMKGLDTVAWINNKNTILKTVLAVIEGPDDVALDRKKWMERIVLTPLNQSSANITKALL